MISNNAFIWAAATLFTGALAMELSWLKVSPPSMPMSKIGTPPLSSLVEKSREEAISISADDRMKIVVARPLFDQDRRPQRASSSATFQTSALPRLSSMIITSKERDAIFVPANGGKAIIAHEGTAMGPWTVKIDCKRRGASG